MPMYEFFCSDCNTIYTFLSRSINTDKVPSCPKCHKSPLERMISRFSVSSGFKSSSESDSEGQDLPIDESKMEHAIASLASEAESINEDDPRQAANFMRKLTNMTGLKLGEKMEEALCRMESGEDPQAIEQEMENIDEQDLFKFGSSQKGGRGKSTPLRDDTLYEM